MRCHFQFSPLIVIRLVKVELWYKVLLLPHDLILTWAKRKHCRNSWLNSGRPEANCFSSAPNDPVMAICQCLSAKVNMVQIKLMRLGLDCPLWCKRSGNGQKAVPFDQSQLNSSHRSIQIWFHLDSWIESVNKARQKRLNAQYFEAIFINRLQCERSVSYHKLLYAILQLLWLIHQTRINIQCSKQFPAHFLFHQAQV